MIEEITITSLAGRGTVTMKTKDYEGYWLGPVDLGQVQGQHQTYRYYNQVGESIVSTTVEGRPLSITGWMIEDKEGSIRAKSDFLNAFISPVEDYELEYKGKKIRFRPDSSVIYTSERRENNKLLRKFLIQATCPYPLFSDQSDTSAAFDSSGKMFRFPQNFGRQVPVVFATQQNTYSVEVNNAGGFQTGIRAKFRFSGTVENPGIKNLTTRKMVAVARTFTRGEQLEICTTAGSKSMTLYTTDGKTENVIKNRDYRTTWLQLAPGRNLLALDCADLEQRDAMAVTVFYTPLYLEVQ